MLLASAVIAPSLPLCRLGRNFAGDLSIEIWICLCSVPSLDAMLCLSELLSDLLSREGIILPRLPMSARVSPGGGHGICPLPFLCSGSLPPRTCLGQIN